MFGKFDQIKDIYAMKKETDRLKKEMEKIKTTIEHGNLEITMLGDQTVTSVTEDGEERSDLVKLFNKAVKESQKQVAKKMKGQLSGLGIPGL